MARWAEVETELERRAPDCRERRFNAVWRAAHRTVEETNDEAEAVAAQILIGRLQFEFRAYREAAASLSEAANGIQDDPSRPLALKYLAQAECQRTTGRPPPRAVQLGGMAGEVVEVHANAATDGWASLLGKVRRLRSPEARLEAIRLARHDLRSLPRTPELALRRLLATIDATERQLAPGFIYDRLLGFVPMRTQLQYQRAAAQFEARRYAAADTEIERLRSMSGGARHVAALIDYVQVGRALGLNRPQLRRRRAEAARKLRLDEVPSLAHGKPRVDLERSEALSRYHRDPATSYSILKESDGPRVRSYLRLRCLTSLGEREEALSEAQSLVDEHDLLPNGVSLRSFIDRPAPRCNVRLPYPRSRWAAVEIGDALRDVGEIDAAVAWLESVTRPPSAADARPGCATFGPALARLSALYNATGRLVDARKLLEEHWDDYRDAQADTKRPVFFEDSLQIARGRTLIAEGRLTEAQDLFQRICEGQWHETVVDGWCGRIDVARRLRNLPEALEIAEQALEQTENETGRAEILIARSWAELQLGDPVVAIEGLVESFQELPSHVGGWIGVMRGLRMLGHHRNAIDLAHELLGGPGSHDRPAWLPSAPSLALRHSGLLRSELGWCLLDIDELDSAAEQFEMAISINPSMSSAHRGQIAALRLATVFEVSNALEHSVEQLTRRCGDDSPAIRDVRVEAGRLFVYRGETDLAAEQFAKVREDLASRSRSVDAHVRVLFAIADAYLDRRQIPDAEDALRELETVLRRGGPEADRTRRASEEKLTVLRVRLHLAKRHAPDATRELDRFIQKQRRSGQRAGRLALSEATRIARIVTSFEDRDFVAARRHLEEDKVARRNWPKSDPLTSDIRELLEAWVVLAESELPSKTKSQVIERINDAEEALERTDQTSSDEVHLKAIIEARRTIATGKGSMDTAVQYLERVLERRPEDASMLRDLAAIHISTGQLFSADARLRDAERIDASDARTRLLRGVYHRERGDEINAIQEFQAAVALDQSDYVHHRALALSLLDAGRTDDALKAVDRGIDVVTAQRGFRLHLLRARIVAAATLDSPSPQAASRRLINEERRLAQLTPGKRHGPDSPSERASLLARRAFLLGRAGRTAQARIRLLEATTHDSTNEEVRNLREQLPSLRNLTTLQDGLFRVLLFAVAVGLAAWVVVELDGGGLSNTQLLVIGGVAIGLALLSALWDRIRKFSVRDITVELEHRSPVEEIVHVDLDLSASRLLLISGFSNYRPDVPFEDADERVTDRA